MSKLSIGRGLLWLLLAIATACLFLYIVDPAFASWLFKSLLRGSAIE